MLVCKYEKHEVTPTVRSNWLLPSRAGANRCFITFAFVLLRFTSRRREELIGVFSRRGETSSSSQATPPVIASR